MAGAEAILASEARADLAGTEGSKLRDSCRLGRGRAVPELQVGQQGLSDPRACNLHALSVPKLAQINLDQGVRDGPDDQP